MIEGVNSQLSGGPARFSVDRAVSDSCVNFFSKCDVFGVGATIFPPDGSADCLESAVEGEVGYDLGDDQEDRKVGNGDLKGFFAFFFWR